MKYNEVENGIRDFTIECRFGLFQRFVFKSLPVVLMILVILVNYDAVLKGHFIWDTKHIIQIFLFLLSPIMLWSLHISIPHMGISVTPKGIHGHVYLCLGWIKLYERHSLIEWKNVSKFEWFYPGFDISYRVWGTNQNGKYGGLGVSVFSTNSMKAVNYIVEKLPKEKIDPLILKKIDKYNSKNRK